MLQLLCVCICSACTSSLVKNRIWNVQKRPSFQLLIQIFFISPLADKFLNTAWALSFLQVFWFQNWLQFESFCIYVCKNTSKCIYKMINIVSKSGNLSPYLKATTQAVASQIKQLSPAVPTSVKIVVPPAQELHTNYSLSNSLPSGRVRVLSGPGGTHWICFTN